MNSPTVDNAAMQELEEKMKDLHAQLIGFGGIKSYQGRNRNSPFSN